jgi:hypothetical protein
MRPGISFYNPRDQLVKRGERCSWANLGNLDLLAAERGEGDVGNLVLLGHCMR